MIKKIPNDNTALENVLCGAPSIRSMGGISHINQVFGGQMMPDFLQYRQASQAGVENADGEMVKVRSWIFEHRVESKQTNTNVISFRASMLSLPLVCKFTTLIDLPLDFIRIATE